MIALAVALALSAPDDGAARQELSAQDVHAPFSRDVEWDGSKPSFGWEWRESFARFSGSVLIFGYWPETPRAARPPRRQSFIARRAFRRLGQPERIQWAQSEACPALRDRFKALEQLPTPTFRVAGLDDEPERIVVAGDGVGWTLWSKTAQQSDDHAAYLTVRSGGGDIATWGVATEAALESCWTENEPVTPVR